MAPSSPRELEFPVGGISEDRGPSDQEPLTAREGYNVRVLDPQTGERRGAQRSGLEKEIPEPVTANGVPVDFLEEVGFSRELVTLTQLDDVDNGTTTPGEVAFDARELTPGGGTAAVVVTDSQRQVYVLDVQAEAVVVYTPDLASVVGTISLPMDGFDSVARTLAVDEKDRIYAASGRSVGPTGGAIWRFAKRGERWGLDWTYEVPEGSVTRLDWRDTLLVAASETVGETGNHGGLLYFSTIVPENPVLLWERSCPYPVGDVALDELGDVLFTAPWNGERRADEDGFGTRSIDWTPYDLADSDERLFFWVEAGTLSGYSTDDLVRHWPETRLDELLWGQDFTLALDDTERYLQHKPGLGWRPAARYDAGAFGTLPGVAFDGERILRTRANLQAANKEDPEDKLKKNRSPIPGVEGATWATCLLVRADVSREASSLMGAKGPLNFGLIVNADESVDPTAADPGGVSGWIQLHDADTTTVVGSTAAEWATGNDTGCILVTVLHGGSGATGASEFRVNGTSVGTLTFNEDRLLSPGSADSAVLVGHPHLDESGVGSDPFGKDSGLEGFSGALAEWVTVLGSTTTTPHDTAPTGAEVEELEGYIAHKYGIQGLLPGGHAHAASPPPGGGWTGTETISEGQRALLDQRAIVAKYRASGGGLAWAYNEYVGAGLRIAPAANEDEKGVVTYGGRVNRFIGAPGLAGPLLRRVIDEGATVELAGAATAVLTATVNASNDETVTIDGRTYTFKTTIGGGGPGVWHVLIGASAEASLENLASAINVDGPEDSPAYNEGIAPHHSVYGEAAALELTVYTHLRGTGGDGLATSTDWTGASWSGSTAGGSSTTGVWAFMQESGDHFSPFAWANLDTLAGLLVDTEGDVYFTRPSSRNESGGVTKLDGTGNADGTTDELWRYGSQLYSAGGPGGDPENLDRPYNAIVFGRYPDTEQDVTGPEHLYVAFTGYRQDREWSSGFARYNLARLRLVAVTRNAERSARGYLRVAVSGGDIKTFSAGDVAFTTPTGGAGALLEEPRRVVGAQLHGKLYLSDGISPAKVVDARAGTVEDWTPERGELPPRITHLVRWRSRMCMVSADAPEDITMARLGDALDLDVRPEVPTAEQALRLELPDSLGKLASPVQALVPYDRDSLVVGLQDSVHVIRGDPMQVALGGYSYRVIGEITTETGLAPGTPWAKNAEGMLFVLASRGAVLAISPGSWTFRDISSRRIRRKLESLDLTQYHVHMQWSYEQQGMHILLLPYGGVDGGAREHLFWEEHTGTWQDGAVGSYWVDTFGQEPSAVTEFDSDDPDGRFVAVGCEDGFVRRFARDAVTDDNVRIYSRVLAGPYSVGGARMDTGIDAVLFELSRGSCNYELYASQGAKLPEVPFSTGEVRSGVNDAVLDPAGGCYVWVRMFNAQTAGSWAHERTILESHEMGMSRR